MNIIDDISAWANEKLSTFMGRDSSCFLVPEIAIDFSLRPFPILMAAKSRTYTYAEAHLECIEACGEAAKRFKFKEKGYFGLEVCSICCSVKLRPDRSGRVSQGSLDRIKSECINKGKAKGPSRLAALAALLLSFFLALERKNRKVLFAKITCRTTAVAHERSSAS